MTTRTCKTTITFRAPFFLSSFDKELPPGAYEVETDEELLQGVSFPAHRRVLTVLHLHLDPARPGVVQTLTVDPNELDAALARDHALEITANSTESDRGMTDGKRGSQENSAD